MSNEFKNQNTNNEAEEMEDVAIKVNFNLDEMKAINITILKVVERGLPFCSGADNLDTLLNQYGYLNEEKQQFKTGLQGVFSKSLRSLPKEEAKDILSSNIAMITFAESVIKILPFKAIPNTSFYYIVPRKIKKAQIDAKQDYNFKLEMQYQAKIDLLSSKGFEIIRAECILADEYKEEETIIEESGAYIIKHTPNLITRKTLAKEKQSDLNHIVGGYVVYKEKGNVKYFFVDYEKILKAKKSSKSSIAWYGTFIDGVKKTAVHRFFEFAIFNNFSDEFEENLELLKEIKPVNEIQVKENDSIAKLETQKGLSKEEIQGASKEVIEEEPQVDENGEVKGETTNLI